MKIISAKDNIALGIVFILFGILFIFAGVCTKKSFYNARENGIPAKGYISDLVSDGDGGYDAYITYTVDGEELTRLLDYYVISMEVGQRVTVYYYPENPEKIYYHTKDGFFYFVTFGVISILAGVGVGASTLNRKPKKRPIDTGIRILAKVAYCGLNDFESNDQRTYIIKAKWTDEHGVLHEFKSEPLLNNLNLVPDKDLVEVFIDPSNYKNYKITI